jgi:hypothetical protein
MLLYSGGIRRVFGCKNNIAVKLNQQDYAIFFHAEL